MEKNSEIRERIREYVLNENSGAEIEDDEDYLAAFSDIGVDSLDVMMVTLKVSEAYGVQFDDDSLADIQSIQDIVNLVRNHMELA